MTLQAKPAQPNTKHALPMALLRARESVMNRFRPLLAKHDINEQQWRVLRILAEVEELDATEVASQANILAPSLTRMIRALSERGLIRKAKDKTDGRRVLLCIEQAGRDVLAAAGPQSREIYDQLEHDYGAEKVALLVAMLNDLADIGDQPQPSAE